MRILYILGVLLFPFTISAQNYEKVLKATNVEYLNQLSEEYSSEFQQEKKKAIELCERYGYPTKFVTPEGQLVEVHGFDENGLIQYAINDNADAAKTISVDKVQSGGVPGFNLSGRGFRAGMWEGANPRSSHQEFTSRIILGNNVSDNDHATHVAGTIMAQGVRPDAKGMANEADLISFDWNNPQSELAAQAANGLLVSNHSWGFINGWATGSWSGSFGWHWWGDPTVSSTTDYAFGRYDANAVAWDQICYNAPYFTIVKSAGNERNNNGPGAGGSHWFRNNVNQWTQSNATRNPDGNYDCQGNMTLAKNAIAVGAVNAIPTGYSGPGSVSMSNFSSWGPADDGRVKPDLVGNGVGVLSSTSGSNTSYGSLQGTSMSAPTITGSIVLLQEHYSNQNNGDLMMSSTVRSLLIHTCDEAGSAPGPDYIYGWGLANAHKAASLITDDGKFSIIEEDTLGQGQSVTYQVFSDGTEPLKATIAWLDPQGTVGAIALNDTTPALVNDLDMRITSTSGTNFPWKLNVASPASPATTGDNRVDNVEVIEIPNPVAGVYDITVNHKSLLFGGSQVYSLIVSGIKTADTLDQCKPLIQYNSYYGVFDDGSESETYANDQDCNWRISVKSLGKVELAFSSFDLGPGDLVTVYNGSDANAPVIGSFTGNTIPSTINSSGSNLFINFSSDGIDDGNQGFTANYIASYCNQIGGLEAGYRLNFIGDTCNRDARFINIAASYDSVLWDYGNGITSNTSALIHNYQYPDGGTYDVKQIAYGVCFTDTFASTVTVPCKLASGLFEGTSQQVDVFPNPVSGVITFDLSGIVEEEMIIRIFDINGKLLREERVNENATSIDISNFENGVFLYNVIAGSNAYNGKILKQ